MIIKPLVAIPICLYAIFVFRITGSSGQFIPDVPEFIPDVSEQCYRCLCHVATKCDLAHGCTGGYCGPFNVSQIYWIDSGKVVKPDDDPNRREAWKDCAKSYDCAKTMIEGYMQRFGQDCNGDNVIDCTDYTMLNFNGGYGCKAPLNQSAKGREWLQRFAECEL